MIPIMLPSGRLVFCGPTQQKIHLQHCPTCGDRRVMEAITPVPDLVKCPACGPASDLWRLLDRRLS